ncbi:hypothetical protein KSS87_005294 [Heliosperma pusillum]|nr:hypothetical protein KSS87_005294 [Heliosperma pusillum]
MSFQNTDRKALPSYFPKDGAIFMANKLTREECLRRKLFGLPSNFTDFVLRIKVGMLLFLYDYQKRKLYGVFEASSNGGLNLVPDAYKSSNLKFPAQVRFTVLWQCAPLQEDAFRDAIKENYFTPYKFNFGLSREQVNRLLSLFERTKLKIQQSHMSPEYHQSTIKIMTPFDESHPWSARKFKPSQEVNTSNNIPKKKLAQTHCGQGPDKCNLTTMKTLPKSMPKKLASIVVCDPKPTPDLDCSITFPSLEPGEIEDPLLHEPVLNLAVCSPGLDELIDGNIGYQIYEHHDEKNQLSGNSRASILYSDNTEERLSVFKRLSGWSKVIGEKNGRVNAQTEHLGQNTNFENIRLKTSINTHVISGLGNDVKMAAKNEQPEKLLGTNEKICKDSKRKDTLLADKQPKRICLRKTKACDELSDVSNLSQGNCKTETSVTVTGDAVVTTDPSLRKPFICGGGEDSVDEKLHQSIQLKASCDQDPVEMLLARYKDYLSRSRMEDQTNRNGAQTYVN